MSEGKISKVAADPCTLLIFAIIGSGHRVAEFDNPPLRYRRLAMALLSMLLKQDFLLHVLKKRVYMDGGRKSIALGDAIILNICL